MGNVSGRFLDDSGMPYLLDPVRYGKLFDRALSELPWVRDLSVKDQIVNTVSFAGHLVSVAIT